MAHHEERPNDNEPQGMKKSAAKHTLNPPQGGHGHPQDGKQPTDQQHDASRRMGSFEGKGEHARTGNRGHQ